jgi:L-threonylcarbamoyladenylate synthase
VTKLSITTQLLTDPGAAAQLLRSGRTVAFPTETVFGLGADACNANAVERIFLAKGRPADNPLIVHLGRIEDWPLAARNLTPVAREILVAFAPGPVTVILPKNPQICSSVSAGLETVGIRIPACPFAQEMLLSAGIPIAAPSANLSGRPSCTNWRAVQEDMAGRVDAIVAVDVPHIGLESSVVDCTGKSPILLRPGGITLEQLQSIFPTARQFSARDCELGDETIAVSSPGMKHPHYQPVARVVLISSANVASIPMPPIHTRSAFCGISQPSASAEFVLTRVFDSIEHYAQEFYEFLREADRSQVATIYVELACGEGIATALRDRQTRAAASSEHRPVG